MRTMFVCLAIAIVCAACGCQPETGSQNPNELPEANYVGHDEATQTPDYGDSSNQ